MTRAELKLLGKAFEAEVNAALSGGPCLLQTKSKLVDKLVDEGYLERVEAKLGGRFPVTVRGFVLTGKGHLTYCTSCR